MVGNVKAFVSGMACRFPKSANVNEFWENLLNGVDMLDSNVWPDGLYGLPPRTGHIPDTDKFDAKFFNIPESEAQHLSVVCRLLLEVIHECIVDSGLTFSDIEAAKTGFYLACTFSDVDEVTTSLMADSCWLNVKSEIVSQLSQMFGFDGPVISVDTACSSAFAAIDVAIGDLITGRCKYAIVAGINLVISPNVSLRFHRLGMLSPTGDSHVYDQSADGYVRSDGVAVIFLSQAESACKRIYASLIDIAISCDGYKEEGVLYPSHFAQSSLLKLIYSRNGVKNKDISYIEMHGTGTQAGDLIETSALADVLCQERDEPLFVGSVKSNMGHCEATSGLAGLIKCILSMHHGVVPACLHYKTANPNIEAICSGQVCVVTEPLSLTGGLIGVSCFGFGGVNGHALLQPYRHNVPDNKVIDQLLIPVTARNEINFNSSKCIIVVVYPDTHNSTTSKFCLVSEAPQKLWVILNDVAWSSGHINKDVLSLSVFAQSLAKSDKVIKEFSGGLSVLENLDVEKTPLSKLSLLTHTVCLIGMMDVYLASDVQILGITGCGLSEIASAYMTGCLTLAQCLQVAAAIGEYLETFATECKKTSEDCLVNTYLVNMSANQAYTLSPQVKVTAILQSSVVLAFQMKYSTRILTILRKKGFSVTDLNCVVPLYSTLMGNLDSLKHTLKNIIKSPRKISPQFMSASSYIVQPRVSVRDDQSDAEYFCRLLQHSYNWKKHASCLPNNLVLLTLNMDESWMSGKVKYHPQTATSQSSGDQFSQASSSSASLEKQCHGRQSRLMSDELADRRGSKVLKLNDRRGSQVLKQNDRRGSQVGSLLGESRHRRPSQVWPIDRLSERRLDQLLYETGYVADVGHEAILHSSPDRRSVLGVLAQLHLRGHKISVGHLLKMSAILDCSAPPLSPLVGWDHSISYPVVDWTYFCCQAKDDNDDVYRVPAVDNGDLWDPLSMALYHTCSAISYKLTGKEESLMAISLNNLCVNSDVLTQEAVQDALVEVHVGRRQFCVSSDDGIILSGTYEIPPAGITLPTIPGYDVDINENIQNSSVASEIETTEILWEGSWLEFLIATLEFAGQHIKWPLVKVMVDPKQHLKIAKTCANILTTVDLIAGLCKAGCLVLQFKSDIPTSLNVSASQLDISSASYSDDVVVSMIVTGSLNPLSSSQSRLMLYSGSTLAHPEERITGILTVIDNSFSLCDIPFDSPWQLSDLQMMVPYILAAYIVLDVAKATEKSSVIVLPPLDTVAIYVIALADQLGCGVYTASWDSEIRADLDTMFPNVRNLSAKNLVAKLRRLTLGLGCDICIKNSATDMNVVIDLVADDGLIIQTVPPSKMDEFGMKVFLRNVSVVAVDPAEAFVSFMEKSTDDIKAILCVMSDSIKRLLHEGYPEKKGFLYSLTESWSSSQPIKLCSLLNVLDKPGLNVCDVLEGIAESDIIALQRIQESFLPTPQGSSILQESSISQVVPVDEMDTFSVHPLYSNMNLPLFYPSSKDLPPLEHLLSVSAQSALSTPVITLIIPGGEHKQHKTTPSLIPPPTIERDPSYRSVVAHKAKPAIDADQLSDLDLLDERVDGEGDESSRQTLCSSGSSSSTVTPDCSRQSQLDLLFVGTPRTPMTPALRRVMMPSKRQPTLVRLNNVLKGTPLYMIHPVTGVLTLLRPIGAQLNSPCVGIQMTANAPRTSVKDIASFYRSCIEVENPCGPYRILGYSLGGMIAFELAQQLQEANKIVDCLIMLDGSPDWAHGQTNRIREMHVPPGTPDHLVPDLLEVGSIMWYMEMLGPIPQREMVQQALEQMPNLRARAAMAVDFMMGNILVSPSPQKTKWLAAKSRLQQKKSEFRVSSNAVFNSVKEIMRLSREKKALETVDIRQMIDTYHVEHKFNGDIHLLRLKCEPVNSTPLPVDYGLGPQCNGKVHISYFSGDHETFVCGENGKAVIHELNKILCPSVN
ncbi:fatty acid synthase-like [Gigantopelta aegis]|uniref:fatty acid synthase-like n=1 Tax=Gigantopelta aegis TaxID=1735272 RepID=UPI001B88B079|nr:fatty acid synthase-like [Gigantopelta aegis]